MPFPELIRELIKYVEPLIRKVDVKSPSIISVLLSVSFEKFFCPMSIIPGALRQRIPVSPSPLIPVLGKFAVVARGSTETEFGNMNGKPFWILSSSGFGGALGEGETEDSDATGESELVGEGSTEGVIDGAGSG